MATALASSGIDVVGLHGRRPSHGAPPVSGGSWPPSLASADVVLVAVRDRQLPAALAELRGAPLAADTVVLHASGSLDPDAALADFRARGHPAGTFHPLVPLADPERATALLRGAWIGIDGDERAQGVSRALAAALGAHVLPIPAGHRATYHAAAVMASNFPVVLAALAAKLLQNAGVNADVGRLAVQHLMEATTRNLADGGTALTGPVIRGDVDTVAGHLAALAADPEALDVYRALTRAAVPIAAAQGADPRQLQRIGAAVGAAASGEADSDVSSTR